MNADRIDEVEARLTEQAIRVGRSVVRKHDALAARVADLEEAQALATGRKLAELEARIAALETAR